MVIASHSPVPPCHCARRTKRRDDAQCRRNGPKAVIKLGYPGYSSDLQKNLAMGAEEDGFGFLVLFDHPIRTQELRADMS